MTTKLIAAPKVPKQDANQQDAKLAVFPEYPPRDDMQNSLYLNRFAHVTALEVHLGNPDTTLVLGEVSVAPSAAASKENRRPDLIVAFNCDRDLLIRQKGYSIETQGKPPDFALEVASESTGEVDYTDKRYEYESYGIPEYWRFDSSGGDYHDAALAGDRLVDGRYEPIGIQEMGGLSRRGYSAVLDLWLCWEDQRLRLFDAKTEEYLRTHDEEYDRAELEAYERRQAEMRAALAETRAERESYERQLAEMRAEYAENRAEYAEAESRRLRAELEAMRRRFGG